MIKMSDIIADIEFLPPFSKVAQKALELLRKEDFTMKMLAEIIMYDAALTANILKVANSAAYTKQNEVSDLQTAISLIGSKEISSIIMISAAKKYFEGKMTGYEMFQGEIWEHSLSVAIISQHLHYLEPGIDSSILYTAALLHSIGKIVLSQYVQNEVELVNDLTSNDSFDFITIEKKVVGFTHPVVGAAILKKWNFSKTISDVAKYYKDPCKIDSPYVRLVAIADHIAVLIGKTSQRDGLQYKGCSELFAHYKIKSRDLDDIISASVDKINDLIESFK